MVKIDSRSGRISPDHRNLSQQRTVFFWINGLDLLSRTSENVTNQVISTYLFIQDHCDIQKEEIQSLTRNRFKSVRNKIMFYGTFNLP